MNGIAVSVGPLAIAIDITEVAELIPNCALVETTGTGSGECGVFNLRGKLVRVLDLADCLNVDARVRPSERRLVVLAGRWSGWALRVDSVYNTVVIPSQTETEGGPDSGSGTGSCLGMPCIDSELRTVLALRLDRLFAVTKASSMGRKSLPENALDPMSEEARLLEDRRVSHLPSRGPQAETAQDDWMAAVLIDEECYGLPVPFVREFVRAPKTAPLPGAPHRVAGLMTLRGEILCALHPVLAPDACRSGRPFAVVLEIGPARAALLVDAVVDVVSYGSAMLQAAPVDSRMPITGVLRWPDRFVAVLDVSQLFREAGAGSQLLLPTPEE